MSDTTARDIKLVSHANRSQSVAVKQVVSRLGEVKRITERNVQGVSRTRSGTADLLRHAQTLAGMVKDVAAVSAPNGRKRAR